MPSRGAAHGGRIKTTLRRMFRMASARNTDKNRIRRRRLGRLEEIDALELPDLDDVDLDDGGPEGTFPDGEPSGGETSDGEGGAASAAAPSGESAEDRQAAEDAAAEAEILRMDGAGMSGGPLVMKEESPAAPDSQAEGEDPFAASDAQAGGEDPFAASDAKAEDGDLFSAPGGAAAGDGAGPASPESGRTDAGGGDDAADRTDARGEAEAPADQPENLIEAAAEINSRMPWTRIFRKRRMEKAREEALSIERDAIVLTECDPGTGLTEKQVSDRTKLGMVNVTSTDHVRTTRQIVLSHTLTYFNLLNLALGVLVFLTGQFKNMLFLGVIVSNAVIGIAQELKVKQLIDRLSVITAAKADVLRAGKKSSISVNEIVRDEIIFLKPGDQIVTDGKLVGGVGVEVNESMLTGESNALRKRPGDPLLSGSFVVSGTGTMQAEKVGDDCYAATIVAKTRKKRRASSEMQTAIGRIIKIVSVVIIPLGLLLYRSQHAAAVTTAARYGYDARWIFSESVVRTVSGIIGMIPEGLVLLTSVSFIIGVGRLAAKNALVQEMEAIEALVRANIICTDKTGTITTGTLEVSKLIAVGDVRAETIRTIMAHMNGACSDKNETQEALEKYFGKKSGWTVTDLIPFSSERKFRAASFEKYGSFVVGAPEFLVPDNRTVLDFVDGYAKQGYRCLLLCRSTGISSYDNSTGHLHPISVIVISDIIKEDARDVFDYFAKAGVQVKVISGDNPATVSAVAAKAGVAGADRYVDASTLPANPVKLAQEIAKYNVFGRVKPEQKQAFVRAWQVNGNTVAMVGDGVNDVLAIKDADCGIAMAKGSDAAKQAAHIVLMNSDFTSMKDIVKEGKTIICNIERVSSLYLTKTIYSALLSLIFIILARAYPWTTLQMGLINVVGIGMPSFLLTLEQHDEWKAEGFVMHVLRTCLPAAITMVGSVMLVQILSGLFRWDAEMTSYFTLMLGGFVAMLVVGAVSWPLNLWRRIVLTASVAVFAAAILFLPGFYDIHSLWTPWTLLLLPLGILVIMLIYWTSRKTNKLVEQYEERRSGRRHRGHARL